jgi:hypothetical protein
MAKFDYDDATIDPQFANCQQVILQMKGSIFVS